MAIISFTNYKRGQTTGCMSAVMRYTMQDKKTEFEGQQLVTGINCQPESVYADFMTTKRLYHKTDGVLFYHMVHSFPKGWPSTMRDTKFWSAPTQTVSTSIPTSSSTRSISIPDGNCISQRSSSRNCGNATTWSARSFHFLYFNPGNKSRKQRL